MSQPLAVMPSLEGVAWLDGFPSQDGTALISENRAFMHPEGAYDDQYAIQAYDESGSGINNLLRAFACDTDGPVLELGCGTGKASVGLCKTAENPWLVITDSSTTFVDITRHKLLRNNVDLSNVRFAVLSDTDLDRLPSGSLSAIVLRSVLHHFLDVPGWIKMASRALRPGGAIVFEEPCSPGYLLMGLVAQTVALAPNNGLNDAHRAQAQLMADTMKAYHRRDQDKSTWEDKHLFRPNELMSWARESGLEATYIPNGTYEAYAHNPLAVPPSMEFEKFFSSYLQYCMNFGAESADVIIRAAKPFSSYVEQACAGTQEPYLYGVFVLQKPHDAPRPA